MQYRRRALASLNEKATSLEDSGALVFSSPLRQRLRISVTSKAGDDGSTATNAIDLTREANLGLEPLDARLAAAQQEIVEEELFSEVISVPSSLERFLHISHVIQLIKEAGSFPSVAAYVSEKKISIVAAHDLELTFEMVRPHRSL